MSRSKPMTPPRTAASVMRRIISQWVSIAHL
jgi:hypothetical protein